MKTERAKKGNNTKATHKISCHRGYAGLESWKACNSKRIRLFTLSPLIR